MARRSVTAERVSELLPGKEWIAAQHSMDDGDTWPICPGRIAEYDYDRRASVVREMGKEIGFIPVFSR